MKRFVVAVLLLAAFLLPALVISAASDATLGVRAGARYTPFSSPPGDWPMYGHDPSRTNFNPDENTLTPSNIGQLVSRWQASIGSDPSNPSSSAPSVSGGSVFVGSSAPSGHNFFAFDAASGTLQWSVSLSYTSACWNVGIGSTAAISGTVVTVGGGDTAYYGLDAATGGMLWRDDLNAGASAFPWASPLLAYGRSYEGVASYCDNPSVRGEVRAVDLDTGAHQASQFFVPAGTAGGGVWNSPALSPDGSTLAVVTGEDYNCGSNCQYTRAMVTLDPLTLNILGWHQEGPAHNDQDYGTTPVIFHDSQGRTLVGANHKDGTFYAYLLSDVSAGPIWSRSLGVSVGTMPAYDPTHGSGGTLFIPAGGGNMYAVDPATGADRPGWNPGALGYSGNVAIANGMIFVGGGTGGLKIVDENTGQVLRTLMPSHAGDTNSGVAVAHGFVYWVSGSYLNAWSLPASSTPTPTFTPVPTATTAPQELLVGHVNWQGPPAQPNVRQQLPVSLTLSLNGTQTDYPLQTTDANGFFTVTVSGMPAGVYSWWAVGPRYMSNCGTIALNGSASPSLEGGTMEAGDASGDDVDNTVDFNMLRTAFGHTSDLRSDFNNDGVVNTSDFNLLKINFAQAGCAPPGP